MLGEVLCHSTHLPAFGGSSKLHAHACQAPWDEVYKVPESEQISGCLSLCVCFCVSWVVFLLLVYVYLYCQNWACSEFAHLHQRWQHHSLTLLGLPLTPLSPCVLLLDPPRQKQCCWKGGTGLEKKPRLDLAHRPYMWHLNSADKFCPPFHLLIKMFENPRRELHFTL